MDVGKEEWMGWIERWWNHEVGVDVKVVRNISGQCGGIMLIECGLIV